MWKDVIDVIKRGRRFVITTHVNPDGDGLGTEISLAEFLREMGKDVCIVNSTPVPEHYRFLRDHSEFSVYDSYKHDELIENADAVFILDISSWDRLGLMKRAVSRTKGLKVTIDHHPYYGDHADIAIIQEDASSVGEMIYDLINQFGHKISRKMAEALYISILTDTGSFRFSNTTGKVHRMAEHLIELGVIPHKIYQDVYERFTHERMKLLGFALLNSELTPDGRIGWMALSEDKLEEFGVNYMELEGFMDPLRSIDGLEIAILFVELEPGKIKVGIRSKGTADIHVLAQSFGGGGHPKASGFTMEASLDEAVEKVVAEAGKYLR